MVLTFEHLEDNKWYVVFPEYEGNFEDLEMVEGSDKLLDWLTLDGLYVTLEVFLEEPTIGEYFTLHLKSHDDNGAYYDVVDCDKYQGNIWLCNVTHEFFGEHPEKIYCSIIDKF